jgi:hypothetical protein
VTWVDVLFLLVREIVFWWCESPVHVEVARVVHREYVGVSAPVAVFLAGLDDTYRSDVSEGFEGSLDGSCAELELGGEEVLGWEAVSVGVAVLAGEVGVELEGVEVGELIGDPAGDLSEWGPHGLWL